MNSPQIRTSSTADLGHAYVAYAATRVRIIVADHLSVDLKDVSDSFSFTRDGEADSLSSVELLLALEEEFHCEFSEEAAEAIHTVGDAVHYIMECSRHRTSGISLAESARQYWPKPVKLS